MDIGRREFVAGALGLGVLGAGAYTATSGDTGTVEAFELETLEAPGSEAGTADIPRSGDVTVVKFFATWCGSCASMMPEVRTAYEEIGDDVQFVSVTYEPLGHAVTSDDVADWWRNHDGAWTVAHDADFLLTDSLGVGGVPTTVVLDAENHVVAHDTGYKTEEEILGAVERASG